MQITQEILLKDKNLTKLIKLALDEDLNGGDLSSEVLQNSKNVNANFVAKDNGIIAGLIIIPKILKIANKNLKFKALVNEGANVEKTQIIAKISGNIKDILSLERTLLNFVSRISGVATYTNKMVKILEGSKPKIYDTRKTIPGWRILDKYAVNMGGGQNHRLNLSDYLMFKDNHLECDKNSVMKYLKSLPALSFRTKGEKSNIKISRESCTERSECAQNDNRKLVEVEIDNFKYFEKDYKEIWNADIIMLDNMNITELKKAIKIIRNKPKKYEIEISGGLSIENLKDLKNLDVDRISIGKITHSAPSFDISLDF